MKSTMILAALAASLTGAAAYAEPKAPPPPPAMETGLGVPATTPGQRYCIESEVTGSRLRHRECHTAAQWRALDVDVLALTKR